MKKSIFYIVFLLYTFSIIHSGCTNDSGTNNQKTDSLVSTETTPIVTEEGKLYEYKQPKEFKYSNHTGDFLYDKFFPIGWSKTGRIAYVIELADEAIGNYLFEIHIKNLISDKTEWIWKTENMETGDFKTVWNSNYEMFKKYLNQYEIIPLENFEITRSRFTHKGKDYTIRLENKTETNADYGIDIVKETHIYLESPQLGKKETYEYKNKDNSMILGQIVPGCFLSPYEDRIAIILKSERIGYEGPPNVIYFDITGSNLNESFTPDKK